MLTRLHSDQIRQPLDVTIATFEQPIDEFAAKHKVVFAEVIQDGLGIAKLAALETHSGTQFLISCHPSGRPSFLEISVAPVYHDFEPILCDIVDSLRLAISDLEWHILQNEAG